MDIIRNVKEYVDNNIKAIQLPIHSLHKEFGVSKSKLEKEFKESYKETLFEYLNKKKVRYIIAIRQENDKSLEDVMEECNYKVSIRTFNRWVKKVSGIPVNQKIKNVVETYLIFCEKAEATFNDWEQQGYGKFHEFEEDFMFHCHRHLLDDDGNVINKETYELPDMDVNIMFTVYVLMSGLPITLDNGAVMKMV